MPVTPSPAALSAERRQFKMHEALLYSVIQKQAGSLAKAGLEGTMNSVDAGATRVDITCDGTTVVIADDGRGFTSAREIEEFFETFGTPHAEGDAKFGFFRMGRGHFFIRT